MRERTFVRSWMLFSVVGVAIVAALNVMVDPYGIFGMPRIDGFNALKPSIGTKVRTAKVHQVMKVRPKTIVIGNSRPEIGLDPAHPCWPAASRPVYNIAIPGMSVFGQIRYGQHAIASGEVGLILLGLDFMEFLVPPDVDHDPRAWPVTQAKPMRLAVDARGQPRSAFFLEPAPRSVQRRALLRCSKGYGLDADPSGARIGDHQNHPRLQSGRSDFRADHSI